MGEAALAALVALTLSAAPAQPSLVLGQVTADEELLETDTGEALDVDLMEEEEAKPRRPVALEEEQDDPYDDGLARGRLRYQHAQPQRANLGNGPTRVSVETGVPTPRSGSFAARIFIDNTAGPKGRVRLEFTSSAGQNSISVARDVELRAGERRVVHLPVPAEARYGTLRASGPGVSSGARAQAYYVATHDPQRVLLSLGKPQDFEALVGRKPAYSSAQVWVVSVEPSEAPAELASYSGYDAVVVADPRVLESLSDAQRSAIEAYAATGGKVVTRGSRGVSAAFPLAQTEPVPSQPYGFGLLVTLQGGELARARDFQPTPLVVSPNGQPPSWQRRYGRNSGGGFLLPMATAPLGRFLLIILLFSLVIGPGSVWVARRRGPAALLVTIPATAFVTCALIIGYSLVADGFTVHGSTFGMTILDSSRNRAISAGITAYYANLAPGQARFGELTTVVSPWVDEQEHHAASATWGNGVRYGADFVPSRVYREWGFLSVEPSRARVVVKQKGDGWVVQNALGARVTSLLVNVDGKVLEARDVKDGAEAKLTRTSKKGLGTWPTLRGETRLNVAAVRLLRGPLEHDGDFAAFITGEGFVPTGGLHLSLHDSGHVVRGEVQR